MSRAPMAVEVARWKRSPARIAGVLRRFGPLPGFTLPCTAVLSACFFNFDNLMNVFRPLAAAAATRGAQGAIAEFLNGRKY